MFQHNGHQINVFVLGVIIATAMPHAMLCVIILVKTAQEVFPITVKHVKKVIHSQHQIHVQLHKS